ncbi:hypothetical protein [Methylobacterium sp. CCH5-D2]|uniref:STY1053 family phage-associated protein n=1 Tax=Methylobacterium sp. CCH5-D2 TaxID=1768765 RepID=UPI00082D644D|nr:hypothetical protein [Methylobacterium sp. CCH5-D2]
MKTIHVIKAFVLALTGGERVPYSVGTHRNVPDEHADHWFTKLHCGEPEELPDGVVDPGEFAMLRRQVESLKDAGSERDAAVAERDAAVAARDALVTERDAAKAEIARLTGELEAAHALISEASTPAASAEAPSAEPATDPTPSKARRAA